MTNPVEEKVIAGVIMGQEYDGETYLYYNDQPLTAEQIAQLINDSIKNGKQVLKLEKYEIELDKVWAVKNWITEERIIINEDNALIPIENKIPNMSVKQLCNAMRDMFDWILNENDEDERGSIVDIQDKILDKIEERYNDLVNAIK